MGVQGRMKFRIVRNAWWMFWARGMVLWPWVWLKPVEIYPAYDINKYEDWYKMREHELFRHELQHCYQIEKNGVLKFYAKYIYYWFRYGLWWGGYKNNPFEVEANAVEKRDLTPLELKWYLDGRITIS